MKPDRRFEAYQQFVLDCKVFWSTRLYPALKTDFEHKAALASQSGEAPARTAEDIARLLEHDTLHQFYSWYERHLQRMKYSGRLGLVPQHERSRDEIERRLAQADCLPQLTLDPTVKAPGWYTAFDVHQHPGGVWGDSLAGVVYERGARSTTPLAQRHADLHERFTDEVRRRASPRRMVDLGCGFGKSTRPFYLADPDLDLVAVDLAAPCLRLAALTSRDDTARRVRFLQRDAADTGLESGGFDTVTSTMLLHEVPPEHLERIFAESCRLLAAGGIAIHLDFLVPEDDPFGRFIHFSHGRRNNEPFMRPLCEMDLRMAHERAGFREVEILPFEEAPGALAPTHSAWRFPWAMVIARK